MGGVWKPGFILVNNARFIPNLRGRNKKGGDKEFKI